MPLLVQTNNNTIEQNRVEQNRIEQKICRTEQNRNSIEQNRIEILQNINYVEQNRIEQNRTEQNRIEIEIADVGPAEEDLLLFTCVCVCIYIYIYIYSNICIYIYIYICVLRADRRLSVSLFASHVVVLLSLYCLCMRYILAIFDPPLKQIWGCLWLCLQAQEGNIYFTELAERVEYGNYVLLSYVILGPDQQDVTSTMYSIVQHNIVWYGIVQHSIAQHSWS